MVVACPFHEAFAAAAYKLAAAAPEWTVVQPLPLAAATGVVLRRTWRLPSASLDDSILDDENLEEAILDEAIVEGSHLHAPMWTTYTADVAWSRVWASPILYLSAHDATGTPTPPPGISPTTDTFTSSTNCIMSMCDHPITGLPTWLIHPCRSNANFTDLHSRNVSHHDVVTMLVLWLSELNHVLSPIQVIDVDLAAKLVQSIQ